MSSAQLDLQPLDESSAETEAAPFVLKEQVAERLAAHRARRTRAPGTTVTPIAAPSPVKARAASIAAAVAERYAHSQSYRDFLAAEAERAIREAEAAAEVAAISARAVAEAQNQLLFELDQLNDPAPTSADPSPLSSFAVGGGPASAPTNNLSSFAVGGGPAFGSTPAPHGGLTVRLYEEVERNPAPSTFRSVRPQPLINEDEAYALDEEIAFRQSPVFDEHLGAPIGIPANLLEFPRQLIAARRARPRLAEGPLREEADLTPDAAQLRIFEVEATQISSAPAVEAAAPEWSSIMLSALPAAAPVETPEAPFNLAVLPQTAPFSLRLMAGIVDACIIMAAFLAFTATAAFTVNKLTSLSSIHTSIHMVPMASPMPPQLAALTAIGTLVIFGLLYQLLFFTFSESTPGMRYARIALCTFADDNPTRSAMRRRIFAAILAACPLGIGFLWACLDDDGLGWHDRISRMYQRTY